MLGFTVVSHAAAYRISQATWQPTRWASAAWMPPLCCDA